jgi:adenylyltransferase/sulfurtransferase
MNANTRSDGVFEIPERYSRQVNFAPLGEEGQRRLLESRVLLCGCGALGTVLANALCRAGVGYLRVVDRDFVELSNLQRQILFDENDVAACLPKAEAAARKLKAVNSEVSVEAVVADVDHTNILDLAADVDLILDGTDNFETRYLINEAAVKLAKPWVFGGCVGSHGQTMTIVPGQSPCLRCVIESSAPPGMAPTCETAGILGPTVSILASLQATEALKILSGRIDAISRDLVLIDVWDGTYERLEVAGLVEAVDCPVCKRGVFDRLSGNLGSSATILCGRNSVQVMNGGSQRVSLQELAGRLEPLCDVYANRFLVRFTAEGHEFTIFPDGRAIIKGTRDETRARALYARFVAS